MCSIMLNDVKYNVKYGGGEAPWGPYRFMCTCGGPIDIAMDSWDLPLNKSVGIDLTKVGGGGGGGWW